ncbi:protein mono-ADP-ribosyltransferase PARP4-like isoform X2 [Sardina pilchardus]|uniref:protein mono-ADP-ribosyltransferase PARP4-like isoform X2 n=1 Tax=Sardina pilchardus TaxID=27697 RepID=UPI002E15A1B0
MLRALAQAGGGAYEFFDTKTRHTWSEKVHALFSNCHTLVYGFVPHCTQATLYGDLCGQEIKTMVSTTELQKTKGTFLHKLTARAVIRDYEDGILHMDEAEHEGKKAQMKSFIVELSKEFSVLSQFTSFVAIEDEKGRKLDKGFTDITKLIAEEDVDLLPHMGWEDEEEALKEEEEEPPSLDERHSRSLRSLDFAESDEKDFDQLPVVPLTDIRKSRILQRGSEEISKRCGSPASSPYRNEFDDQSPMKASSFTPRHVAESDEEDPYENMDEMGSLDMPQDVAESDGEETYVNVEKTISSFTTRHAAESDDEETYVNVEKTSSSFTPRHVAESDEEETYENVEPPPFWVSKKKRVRRVVGYESPPPNLRKHLCVSWEQLASLQSPEGYWECTAEVGLLLGVDLNFFANVFLKEKGISSLGPKAQAAILRLVSTLLVLQLVRVRKLVEGELLQSLFRLRDPPEDEDSPYRYVELIRAVDWVRWADRQYPCVCSRLEFGRDWESSTRQLLGFDRPHPLSPLNPLLERSRAILAC